MSVQKLLDLIAKQERDLSFESFTNQDALLLGVSIAKRTESSARPVAIRIYLDDILVFQYTMKGKEESHYGYAERKVNLLKKTGHSSMYAQVSYKGMGEYAELREQTDVYSFGAGSFPITVNGEMKGAVGVSGLVDPEDHDLIVKCICETFDKKTEMLPESVLKGEIDLV